MVGGVMKRLHRRGGPLYDTPRGVWFQIFFSKGKGFLGFMGGGVHLFYFCHLLKMLLRRGIC